MSQMYFLLLQMCTGIPSGTKCPADPLSVPLYSVEKLCPKYYFDWLFVNPISISRRYYQYIVIDEELVNLDVEFYFWNMITNYHADLISYSSNVITTIFITIL